MLRTSCLTFSTNTFLKFVSMIIRSKVKVIFQFMKFYHFFLRNSTRFTISKNKFVNFFQRGMTPDPPSLHFHSFVFIITSIFKPFPLLQKRSWGEPSGVSWYRHKNFLDFSGNLDFLTQKDGSRGSYKSGEKIF